MKTQIMKKGKWWLMTAILAVALMAVSLSFCTWDDYSLKAVSANGKTGSYTEAPDWSTIIKGANGETLTTPPKVGDNVQYGKFYQETAATTPTAQRWIVVDIDANKVATLLAEKVVVFGNFWGNGYYQNYYQSTLRAWLNSGRDSVTGSGTNWIIGNIGTENKRDDGVGSAFSGNAEKQVNKGFLDVAFNDSEKSILVPKNIFGIKGFGKNDNSNTVHAYTTRNSNSSINDLVWVPSWSEIYGTTTTPWGATIDGSPSKQFDYYKNNTSNSLKVAGATAYALDSSKTNYYNDGAGGHNNAVNAKTATWWWLRSPNPSNYHHSLMVNTDGSGGIAGTNNSLGGVRPAVCVQL